MLGYNHSRTMYNSLNFSNSKHVCLLTWNPDQMAPFLDATVPPKILRTWPTGFWIFGLVAWSVGRFTFKKYGGLRVWANHKVYCKFMVSQSILTQCFMFQAMSTVWTLMSIVEFKGDISIWSQYPPIAHSHVVCVCVDCGDFWHQLRLISKE